ncbi:unnamed protein product [Pneumocystis jirovecii]|uniref:Thioredoxin-like fold domain-containing protein n=2 Tax=Pneumocystis jirovecii TaxID=42068 RepID=L0PAU6_PNEJI|nr:uncharacterized protein T551_03361 [Pneumocystis jirovecii RU7]KTW26899.1 hypothetical protein T551_03361 [Pneumocystis jirovecii RU7]CCJ29219.1 unnamed protein product [Pneumocystis jirovecii]
MILPSAFDCFCFGNSASPHCLELFLDFTCPFSKKLFKTVYEQFFPWVQQNKNDIKFLFRSQVQPWHPSSTLLHEAVLAVSKLSESQTINFTAQLFEHQEEYFDTALVQESRLETYKRLSVLAKNTTGIDPDKFMDLLYIEGTKIGEKGCNVGNKVTTDLKLLIRYSRGKSVHVSPTVFFNGVINDSISSSWTFDNFKEWYSKAME